MQEPLLTVRRATPEDAFAIARVRIDSWRQAYASFVDPDFLARMDVEQSAERWKVRLRDLADSDPTWVACDEDRVIGFVVVGANRYSSVPCDGELQAIYVDPSAQRRGVGKALLRPAVAWLLEQGYRAMAVFAFKDNPAGTNFYRSLAAEFFSEGEYEVGGRKYPDVAYVWRSLAALQARLP